MNKGRTRTDRVVDAIGRRIPELLGVGVLAIVAWAAPWWVAVLVAVPLGWVFCTGHRTAARTAAARGGPHRRRAVTEPADDEPGEGERSA
jgi:hypothetical protein